MDDLQALSLQLDWGVDEALAASPVVRWRVEAAVDTPAARARPSAPPLPSTAADTQPELAAITTIGALYDTWAQFGGCGLRATATTTVRPSGEGARHVLMLGDAPSADDDRAGLAFSGPSGAMLDRVLASAGLGRADISLAHLVPWRPPGNRPPSEAELRVCLPFVYRLLQLSAPRRVVLMGQGAARMLLGSNDRLSRLRGRWQDLTIPNHPHPISAMAMAPVESWLRSPAGKRDTWDDLLLLCSSLD